MRRLGRVFAAGLILMLLFPAVIFADPYTGESGWNVEYTAAGVLQSSFASADVQDAVAGMQPGDTHDVKVAVRNRNAATTDWYMKNQILKSLEDGAAASEGAYSYILTYTGADGNETELFKSDTVGGTKEAGDPQGTGLHAVDPALKDHFYLGTLKYGESGTVTLRIALDGESQGNRYQNTNGKIEMEFAVEKAGSAQRNPAVNTGDGTVRLLLYMAAAGCVMAVIIYRKRGVSGR